MSQARSSLLREAEYLVALADTGDWEQAAARVGATPEALRSGLRRLAAKTDSGALFHSTGVRRATLSPAGVRILPRARALVEQARLLLDTGVRLRFSAFPQIVAQAAPAIDQFNTSKANTGIRVWYHDISAEHRRDRGRTLLRRVSRGELDLAIAPAGQKAANVLEHYAYGWTLRVVLPRSGSRLRGRTSVTVSDLACWHVICAPVGHLSRERLQRAFDEAGRVLSPVLEISDQVALKAIAEHSEDLVAVLPSDAMGGKTRESAAPVLQSSSGSPYGDSYAIYYHDPEPGQAEDTLRQQALARLVKRLAAEMTKYDDG